jgi:hypothetical protein
MSKYATNRGTSFQTKDKKAFACWFYKKASTSDLGFRLVEEAETLEAEKQ